MNLREGILDVTIAKNYILAARHFWSLPLRIIEPAPTSIIKEIPQFWGRRHQNSFLVKGKKDCYMVITEIGKSIFCASNIRKHWVLQENPAPSFLCTCALECVYPNLFKDYYAAVIGEDNLVISVKLTPNITNFYVYLIKGGQFMSYDNISVTIPYYVKLLRRLLPRLWRKIDGLCVTITPEICGHDAYLQVTRYTGLFPTVLPNQQVASVKVPIKGVEETIEKAVAAIFLLSL